MNIKIFTQGYLDTTNTQKLHALIDMTVTPSIVLHY